MSPTLSPLRYPGGKASLTDFFGRLLKLNGLAGGLYAEPFAGGAGAGIGLLFGGHVDRLAINDADPRVFALWRAMMKNTDRFVEKIASVPLTVAEWERQRVIYLNPNGKPSFDVGFATFYLNRCNRSGILVNGGPIGGKSQTGQWKIDARFHRERLSERVTRLADYRDRIEISGVDATKFLKKLTAQDHQEKTFVYLDPPYYVKGSKLYMNHFRPADHQRIASFMKSSKEFSWLMTYDDVPQIRELYSWAKCKNFGLLYSAYEKRLGGEVLITPPDLRLPRMGGSLKLS